MANIQWKWKSHCYFSSFQFILLLLESLLDKPLVASTGDIETESSVLLLFASTLIELETGIES